MAYTKRDLIDEIAAEVGKEAKVSKRAVGLVLEKLAEVAYREAKKPEGFSVPGICRIDVKERKERRARNPRTGDVLLIGAHGVIRFRPLKKAKESITPTTSDLIRVIPASELPPPAPAPAAPAAPAEEQLLTIKCPHCQVEIEVSQDVIGTSVTCPGCQKDFIAQAAPAPAAPAAAPAIPAAVPAAAPAAPAPAAPVEEHFISFFCPSCHQEIEAPMDMAGERDTCPTCGSDIEIPFLSEAGTSQALKEEHASDELQQAAKSRTLRIELPDEF